MDPRIKDILRHSLLVVALLAAFLFALKHYRRYEARKTTVEELRAATSDASFYRQFDRDDAEATLLRCVALVERARQLGLSPSELLDRVYKRKEKGEYDFGSSGDYPVREKLVRDTLTAAHEAARRLDSLAPRDLEQFEQGRLPPTAREPLAIATIIDPALAPGIDKIVPNLELRPEDGTRTAKDAPPNAIEIAAARRLARDLESAGLIERTVAEAILAHYTTPQSKPDE